MLTADFDYHLPEALIAQTPAPRGQGRLLSIDRLGRLRHRAIGDLPRLLRPGDLLVVNNTRVIPARLLARRPGTGGRVELLLVERHNQRVWTVLARPGRRLRSGTLLTLSGGIAVEVLERGKEGRFRVEFAVPIEPHLERLGHVPLPPYIRRADTVADRDDYQTIFAKKTGAIAAPTAGLHFSNALLQQLQRAAIGLAEITLHVGPGTFTPVKSERVDQHQMEAELFEVPAPTAEAIEQARQRGGRVVAVGTTVVRCLEAVGSSTDGSIVACKGKTELFIFPGFRFRVVDVLLTNFHLPRSTLLMLVCAFAGRQRVLDAYSTAIGAGYRFYSYGDAMLVDRAI